MATRQWYYSIGGKQTGPIGEEQLIQMFASGRLDPDTMVWTQELKEWVTASSIDGLVSSENIPHPPPPPMSRPLTRKYQYAGFWIRVGAYFVDMVVMIIPVCLVSFLFRASTPASDETEQTMINLMDSFINSVIWWVYSAVLESSPWQATVGKKVLGLKVTDLNGQRISFGRATERYFSTIVSALLLCIGFMMVGWTQRKQGLHDMMAGTLVVKQR